MGQHHKAAPPHAGELAEEPHQKLCFGGGGFDEVKDEGGCNAKHCGKGGFNFPSKLLF